MKTSLRIALIFLAAVVLAACRTVPDPLLGEYAALTPNEAARSDSRGQVVRWGGTLAAVEPLPDRTCFQIVGRKLDKRARPILEDRSSGRFLACRAGFYDPEVFAEGRSVTVTGTIDGAEERTIGEYTYRHPRVAAEVIYLWPDDADTGTRSHFSIGLGYGRYD